MELKNAVYRVVLVGGPYDGHKTLLELKETSDILDLSLPDAERKDIYEWREGSYDPYKFDWCGADEG